MNREQFEEEHKGPEDEAISNVYFDCNALDRLNDQAPAQQPATDLGGELKMDKDLGLFDMIQAGDFSTMGGNRPAPAQEQPA